MASTGDPTLARRVVVLQALDLFQALPPEQLERLAEAVVPLAFAAGMAIFHTDRRSGGYLYAVVEGEVELLRAGVRVGVLGPGQWFGDTDSRRTEPGTTAVARIPTSLYALETGQLEAGG
jgi:CRP-like cAMP-binding protein